MLQVSEGLVRTRLCTNTSKLSLSAWEGGKSRFFTAPVTPMHFTGKAVEKLTGGRKELHKQPLPWAGAKKGLLLIVQLQTQAPGSALAPALTASSPGSPCATTPEQEHKQGFALLTRTWRSSNSSSCSLLWVLFFLLLHLSLLLHFGNPPARKSVQELWLPGSCTTPSGAVLLLILNHFPTQRSLCRAPFFLQNLTLVPLGTCCCCSPCIYSAGTWGEKCTTSPVTH